MLTPADVIFSKDRAHGFVFNIVHHHSCTFDLEVNTNQGYLYGNSPVYLLDTIPHSANQ